jgi:hypothetical protein
MFTTPWRWTRTVGPDRAVIFASRFDATGLKARWVLFVVGIRLRQAVLASSGALGVSLRAHPLRGFYYTLSMWENEACLLAFAHGADHQKAVRRMAELGPVNGILVSREDIGARPRWADVLRWVASAEPGPYRMEPASTPAIP